MKTFHLFGLAGVLLAATTLAFAGDAVVKLKEKAVAARADHEHGEHFQKCAKACADCQLACASCFHHCAKHVEHGHKDHAKTMALCNDCADVCALAAKLSARHGPLTVPACEACAKSCDTCAAACEKFKDDKHMAACAKTCRDCAKACREMIKHAHKH